MVDSMEDVRTVEVDLIGREGIVGINVDKRTVSVPALGSAQTAPTMEAILNE